MVKSQSTCDFLVAFPFSRNTLTSLHRRHFLLCAKDDERNTLRMVKDKKGHLSRSISDALPKTSMSLSFVYIVQRLVLRVYGLLLKFDDFRCILSPTII